MKRLLTLFLALNFIFFAFASCAKAPVAESSESQSAQPSEAVQPAEGKTVAICMGSVTHPIHRVIQYGFVTKAQELGMEPAISGLDDATQQELIVEWEKAVENGVQGVAVWTGDDSCYDMMKDFKEQGVYCVVPHFEHDYETTKDFIDRNIAPLARSYCYAAADYIVEKLQEKGITEGTIVVWTNPSGVTPVAPGYFAERIEMLGVDYKVERCSDGVSLEETEQRCIDCINQTSDLVAVFGATGASPYGWNAAIKNTGRTDLIVVGMDYTEWNLGIMREGNIDALICQPFIPEAQASALALYDLFNGDSFSSSEETWFCEKECPIAYVGGEGEHDIEYYQNILDTVEAYFKEAE